MSRSCSKLIVLFALLVVWPVVGCDRDVPSPEREQQGAREDEADEEETDDEEYFYSPFVLDLEGGEFDTVSFKDVGLQRDGGEPDERLLEVVAESLAYEFAARQDELGYVAEVGYDEKMADPSNHVHCGLNHLYVDLWQSEAPDRWGYSLWSGCSEMDKFASEELPEESEKGDLTAQVAPLTASIVDSLAEASSEECYQKTC